MLHRVFKAFVGVAAALALSACATWVNIPPREGDAAIHDPNEETVLGVEIAAVRAAIADKPGDQGVQVILPPGTLPLTYDTILPRISPRAVWSSRGEQEGIPVVEVRELRIRGSEAQVDVIRPWDFNAADAGRQVATVYLSWDPVSQWQADRVVGWHISVEDALRRSEHEPVEVNR
jgi:hypothetical protein